MAWSWTFVPLTAITLDGCGAAWVGSKFAALSFNDGNAGSSVDGPTWVQRSAAAARWAGRIAVSGSGLACAVSFVGGKSATTPDGVTWTDYSFALTGRSVAWGNGVFVAVGGNTNVGVSADGGATGWSYNASGATSGTNFYDIDFSPALTRFCAIASSSPSVATCDDAGATWTWWANVIPGFTSQATKVVWNAVHAVWVAMSSNGEIATAPTGTNDWTARGAIDSGLMDGNWWNLQVVDGDVLAFHDDSHVAGLSSDGGATWATIDTGAPDGSGYYWYGTATDGAGTMVVMSTQAVLVGTFGAGGPPLGTPHPITFEALTWSPDSVGDSAAALPRLETRALEVANYAIATLPRLTAAATGYEHIGGSASSLLPRLQTRAFPSAGGFATSALPRLQASAHELADPAPEFGYAVSTLPGLGTDATLHTADIGSSSAALPRLATRAFAVGGGFAVNELPRLSGVALEDATPPPNRMSLQQSPGFLYAYASNPVGGETLTEALTPGDVSAVGQAATAVEATTHSASASFRHAVNAVEAVVLAAEARSIGQLVERLAEGAVFADLAALAFRIVAVEAVAFADVATVQRRQIEALTEVLIATAVADSRLEAKHLLAEAFALDAIAKRGFDEQALDSVAFADTLVHSVRAFEQLLEAVVLDDVATAGVRFTVLCEEGFTLADVAVSQARLYEALVEGVTFTARFAFGGAEYVAWVVNADTGAATRYDHFGFNSLAPFTISGVERYFGAMDDGLYELVGDTDAGAPISAEVRSGLHDFGTREMKRLPTGYLLYTASGEMVIKIIATSPEGQKEAHYYQLEGRTAQVTREDRFTPDQGIESVLWGWTLLNPNGEDFSVDAVAFFPLAINRRV